jgi:hypothetical protein
MNAALELNMDDGRSFLIDLTEPSCAYMRMFVSTKYLSLMELVASLGWRPLQIDPSPQTRQRASTSFVECLALTVQSTTNTCSLFRARGNADRVGFKSWSDTQEQRRKGAYIRKPARIGGS